MNRLLILAVVVVLLGGCNLLIPDSWGEDLWFDVPPQGNETIQDSIRWVAQNITYTVESEVYDAKYWQDPAQTYAIGTGDCEDFAILALYMVYIEHGVRGYLVAGYLHDNPLLGHAFIEVAGVWYEPQTGGTRTREYMEDRYGRFEWMSYGDVMFRAAYLHRSVAELN